MGTLEDLKALADYIEDEAVEERHPMLSMKSLEQVGLALTRGRNKDVGDFFSYKTDGRPVDIHLDAADRHLLRFKKGHTKDADSGLHPLTHFIARWLIVLDMVLEHETKDQVR